MDPKIRAADEDQTRQRANLVGLRYFDTRALKQYPLFEGVFTNDEMYRYRAVVLSRDKGQMIIGITTKSPQTSLRDFKERFKEYILTYVMISEAGFLEFMSRYDPPEEVHYDDIKISADLDAQLKEISRQLETVKSDDVVSYLINQAARLQASDIHMEVGETQIRIRFRVDGVLHPIAMIQPDKYRLIMQTVASLANISMSAPEPQQGHLEMRRGDGPGAELLNMRIETIPTLYGQDAVIRLFTLDENLLSLRKLGLSAQQQKVVDEIVSHPSGLVLAVGPTGSGKTTTLYSIMKALNVPTRKIITLEDPVEYSVDGLVQIPIKTSKEQSFDETLKAVLRLDPDVVMVGEIRDADTAHTALQAALTGHLVLSTFHANDAPSALARLTELVGDNPLLAPAIRLVIAQRLVRRLDPATKQAYEPTAEVLGKLKENLEGIDLKEAGVSLENPKLYHPGASEDAPFGYIGQTAVVETLEINEELTKAMQKRDALDTNKLREMVQRAGMVTMLQHGLIKALKGETSLEEIYRVVD